MTRDEAVAAVDAAIMLLNDEEPDEADEDGEEDNDVLDALEGLGKLRHHIETRLTFDE